MKRFAFAARQVRLLEIVLGFTIAGVVISHYFSTAQQFENLALGDETTVSQAVDPDGHVLHILTNNDAQEESLLKGWDARGRRPVCFILGYSQAHSINQQKPGDVTFVQLLHDRYIKNPPAVDVLAESLPNASMLEYYAIYDYWSTKLPIKTLILPACMDKMRDDWVRDVLLENLGYANFQIKDMTDPMTTSLNQTLAAMPRRPAGDQHATKEDDLAALKETVQDRVERFLDRELDAHVSVWANRDNVRGAIFNWFYLLRNTVLDISASTPRRMIPIPYEKNLAALNDILDKAKKDGVKVLVYIPPIRFDGPIPYDRAEYAKYKDTVAAMVRAHGPTTYYANLEDIVPGQYWGTKPSTNLLGAREIDYMHFQYRGHQIVADALGQELTRMGGP